MDHLPANHFLSLARPDPVTGSLAGVPDTTTLAAHDFDVDTRTSFMPATQPISRLPEQWEAWEMILDDAISQRLQLGDKPGLALEEVQKSETWRARVRGLPILPVSELKTSEFILRRAHLVLAWIMHFYIHSLPPTVEVRIPPPITLPLLQISAHLQLPPVLTYSDDVLYNWKTSAAEGDRDAMIVPKALRCVTSFTSTPDEEEFYMCSARLELAGADTTDLMRSIMDEIFVGDDIAIRRTTEYLHQLAQSIRQLRGYLLSVKEYVKPEVFYHDIRPWFSGEDTKSGRKWVFEGTEMDPTLQQPKELSGASAGQSSLIQAIDVFLGVDDYADLEKDGLVSGDSQAERLEARRVERSTFMQRMRVYMPRHHRSFITHLTNNPRPLRDFVKSTIALKASSESSISGSDDDSMGRALMDAYNTSVLALKEFRDAHMIIVALYIIGPARRTPAGKTANVSEYVSQSAESGASGAKAPLKGTGGTDLVRFLKGVRDHTKDAIIPVPSTASESK
ncbi:tryptophan 2,3-dioxygenase [Panaeolus papilionaceus]|nr:tryptophan 2,3-dioxygenase [Panaeolus papilionaceus]